MRGGRLDRVAMGAALVVAMSVAQFANAEEATEHKVEALVPLPPDSVTTPPSPAGVSTTSTPTVEKASGAPTTEAPSAPEEPVRSTNTTGTAPQTIPETSSPAAAIHEDAKPADSVEVPAAAQDNNGTGTPRKEALPSVIANPEPPSGARAAPEAPASAFPAEVAPETKPKDQVAPPAASDKEEPRPAGAQAAPADPIAQKLREILTVQGEHVIERKNERLAVETFYSARDYAPLWISAGAPNPRAESVIARLRDAESDGLDSSDYPIPDFKAAAEHPDLLAEAEIKLTNSVLTYARHAQIGRVHFSRISADIQYDLVPPDPAEVLTRMAGARDAGEALESYNPPHAAYQALKNKLAELRGGRGETRPAHIDAGPVLKLGLQDSRVPFLRQRLGLPGDAQDTTYSKALAEAVKKFQREHDLAASGRLTSSTVEALNGTHRGREGDIIIANMERWRWLPRELGESYVMVNIPDYTLRVMSNGSTLWHTKVVVGKPSMPTPLQSVPMRYITVNPTWNVPPSIVYNEYLPVLQQDPTALARVGLRVEYGRDGSVHISQPPGDRNALGRIRFNFPNKFLVYQHDTPDKYMFAHEKRAYSHGCMRVENPLNYAEVLLSIARPGEGYTAERLHRMYGSGEQDIQFHTLIPVHLTYQTAFVDESGKLQLREDIYGRDARLLAALKNEDRRVADVAVEHHRSGGTHHHASRMALPPPQYSSSPFGGFFGRIFR